MRPLAAPSAPRDPAPPRRSTRGALCIAILALPACQRTVDIASIRDPSWAATTIPYTGVREANRQFADYSIVDASVLKPKADRAKSPDPGKRGAPR